jgi:hypothetical protein
MSPTMGQEKACKPPRITYPTSIMAAGNDPKNNQVRALGRNVLGSTPVPVKILMFAEVGGIDGRTGFMLALDAIGKLAVVDKTEFVLALDAIGKLAVVGGSVDKTEFVLVLDAIDELAVVGGSVNQLLDARVVVFVGEVAIGK